MCLAQQQQDLAVELTGDEFDEIPSRAMYGEYVATRALSLAVTGQGDRALEAADTAESLTAFGDARALSAASRAIVALSDTSIDDAPQQLLHIASTSGVWDGVVCAVRAVPALLPSLIGFPEHRVELREVLIRSKDTRLATSAGLATRLTGRVGRLTARECEVMEHVVQGKRNLDIARSLFITLATVKRHLDSAYRKLGAQNRAEAIARYAEMISAETEGSVDT
jgi:DNA-binding NarL/FixJ family response regulator